MKQLFKNKMFIIFFSSLLILLAIIGLSLTATFSPEIAVSINTKEAQERTKTFIESTTKIGSREEIQTHIQQTASSPTGLEGTTLAININEKMRNLACANASGFTTDDFVNCNNEVKLTDSNFANNFITIKPINVSITKITPKSKNEINMIVDVEVEEIYNTTKSFENGKLELQENVRKVKIKNIELTLKKKTFKYTTPLNEKKEETNWYISSSRNIQSKMGQYSSVWDGVTAINPSGNFKEKERFTIDIRPTN